MAKVALTREQEVAKSLQNLKGPGPNADPDLFIVWHYCAAIRAERDKYKIDSAAWEEQVDELIAERDARES